MTQELAANIGLNTESAQASMSQLANLTDAQMKRIAGFVRSANKELQDTAKFAKEAANTDAYEKLAAGAEKARASHAGVNRELLVLTHELSQGNYKRFGGSLLVLAEQTNALEYAMTGAGAAALLLGGAVLGSAALVAEGAIEQDRFNKSLIATSNYAGLTSDSLAAMAHSVTDATGGTLGNAREALEALVASGRFGPAAINAAGQAIVQVERVTGQHAEEIVKDFERMGEGVAKWAADHNQSYHYLTASQYEYIRTLEEQGNVEQAEVENLKLLTAQFGKVNENLGYGAQAWRAIKQAASEYADQVKSVGREQTVGEQLDSLDKQLARMRTARDNPYAYRDGDLPATPRNFAQLEEQRRTLLRVQAGKEAEAAAQAQAGADQQAAISARIAVDSLLAKAKAQSALTEALKKYHAEVAAAEKGGKPYSPEDIKAGEAEVRKQFTPPANNVAANEYANLVAQINAFNKVTDEQADKQRKLTDAEQWGIRMAEDLEKAQRKLSTAQQTSIRLMAWAAEAKRFNAEITAQIKPENTPQQKFRQSEIEAGPGVEKAVRDAQLAEDQIRHANQVQLEFNDSYGKGFEKASKIYISQAANNAAYSEQLLNDTLHNMEGALEEFEKTGKLSIKSLVDSWISDFLRMENQKALAGLLNGNYDWGGGSSPLKYLGSLGGGSSGGVTMGSFADLFSGEFGGGFYANGLDYVPHDNFPAMLHEGEKVVRAQDAHAQRGSSGMHFDFSGASYSFGEGVSTSQVAQQVKAGNAQVMADISRAFKTGRVAA